jgi:hypothetical protein
VRVQSTVTYLVIPLLNVSAYGREGPVVPEKVGTAVFRVDDR